MKFLRIPDNNIYHAYMLLGEDIERLREAALRFAESVLSRSPAGTAGAPTADGTELLEEHQSGGELPQGYARAELPQVYAQAELPQGRARVKLSREAARTQAPDILRRRIREGNHPDLIRLTHEKPNLIAVEDVRTQLNDTVLVRPYESEYKIYLIEEADKLNPAAQNAILKTLEEPPSYVIILLLARNDEQFLDTIRSRVVTLRDAELAPSVQLQTLMKRPWAEAALKLLANAGMNGSLQIFDFARRFKEEKGDARELLFFLELFFRDCLYYACSGDTEALYFQSAEDWVLRLTAKRDRQYLGSATQAVARAVQSWHNKASEELVLENLFLTLDKA